LEEGYIGAVCCFFGELWSNKRIRKVFLIYALNS